MFATVVQSFLVKHFSNQFDFNPFSFSHYDNYCNLKKIKGKVFVAQFYIIRRPKQN